MSDQCDGCFSLKTHDDQLTFQKPCLSITRIHQACSIYDGLVDELFIGNNREHLFFIWFWSLVRSQTLSSLNTYFNNFELLTVLAHNMGVCHCNSSFYFV
jgi:hypothetical protein